MKKLNFIVLATMFFVACTEEKEYKDIFPRATTALIITTEVEFSSQGTIQTFANLREALKTAYRDLGQAPVSVIEILEGDRYQLAEKYGFYKLGPQKESALIWKGSTLGINAKGHLFFKDIRTGVVKDLTAGEKYSSKMVVRVIKAPIIATEVEFSSRGTFQTFTKLKESLKSRYPNLGQVPASIREILEGDRFQLAVKYGFYEPKAGKSALIWKGSTLGIDTKGHLFFKDIRTGIVKDLTAGGKYSSKMIAAYGPTPRVLAKAPTLPQVEGVESLEKVEKVEQIPEPIIQIEEVAEAPELVSPGNFAFSSAFSSVLKEVPEAPTPEGVGVPTSTSGEVGIEAAPPEIKKSVEEPARFARPTERDKLGEAGMGEATTTTAGGIKNWEFEDGKRQLRQGMSQGFFDISKSENISDIVKFPEITEKKKKKKNKKGIAEDDISGAVIKTLERENSIQFIHSNQILVGKSVRYELRLQNVTTVAEGVKFYEYKLEPVVYGEDDGDMLVQVNVIIKLNDLEKGLYVIQVEEPNAFLSFKVK